MRSRSACYLVAILSLWPALALAQPPKAGVVTPLQGQAAVARGATSKVTISGN